MNGWKALGYVFTMLGIVFLVIAVAAELPVLSSINILQQFSSETFLSVFIAAIMPYLIIAFMMFVIAAGGFYAGRTRHVVYARGRGGYSRIRCGGCGAINDLDAEFCKKCGQHFR